MSTVSRHVRSTQKEHVRNHKGLMEVPVVSRTKDAIEVMTVVPQELVQEIPCEHAVDRVEEGDERKEKRTSDNEVVWRRESKKVDEEGGKQKTEKVYEDVMDCVEVKRKVNPRTAPGRCEEEVRKSRRMVQVFVKVDGSRAITMKMALSDKVSDIMRRITTSACCSKRDVYVTYELRRCEELRSCKVTNGSTLEAVSKTRGGGKLKDKKNKAE